ncbi:hypothetical protein KAR91_09760 [Candidatus Pacearchaeota archaeon]|nr:hypothetical protein [Candidatus Pacearchaeota archaeon]
MCYTGECAHEGLGGESNLGQEEKPGPGSPCVKIDEMLAELKKRIE